MHRALCRHRSSWSHGPAEDHPQVPGHELTQKREAQQERRPRRQVAGPDLEHLEVRAAAQPPQPVADSVSWPPVDSTAFVSTTVAVATPPITVASSVPLIVTVTTCDVPSAVVTVKLSVTVWPAARLFSALPVVYVHAPVASTLKLP